MWKQEMKIDEWVLDRDVNVDRFRITRLSGETFVPDQDWDLGEFLCNEDVPLATRRRFADRVMGLKEGVGHPPIIVRLQSGLSNGVENLPSGYSLEVRDYDTDGVDEEELSGPDEVGMYLVH